MRGRSLGWLLRQIDTGRSYYLNGKMEVGEKVLPVSDLDLYRSVKTAVFFALGYLVVAAAAVLGAGSTMARNSADSDMNDSTRQVYTFLSPEDVERLGGIPPQVIVGFVTSDALRTGRVTPETFTPNSIFRAFMHDTLGRCGLQLPGMRNEARRIGHGYVYLIDEKTATPQGRVPPEAIIGAFEARLCWHFISKLFLIDTLSIWPIFQKNNGINGLKHNVNRASLAQRAFEHFLEDAYLDVRRILTASAEAFKLEITKPIEESNSSI